MSWFRGYVKYTINSVAAPGTEQGQRTSSGVFSPPQKDTGPRPLSFSPGEKDTGRGPLSRLCVSVGPGPPATMLIDGLWLGRLVDIPFGPDKPKEQTAGFCGCCCICSGCI